MFSLFCLELSKKITNKYGKKKLWTTRFTKQHQKLKTVRGEKF